MKILENTLQDTIEKEEKALEDDDGSKPPSEPAEGSEDQLAIIKSLKVCYVDLRLAVAVLTSSLCRPRSSSCRSA